MKKLIFIVAIGLFFSCERSDVIPENELSQLTPLVGESGMPYAESIDNWNALKSINGNSYTYQTTSISWINLGSITELKVVDGIVTSRIYQQFLINETNGEREIIDSYTETVDNLGVNENGTLPLTIDELYSTCASEYLTVDVNNNTIYFETALNGLMTLCGFVPNGCLDDCYMGVRMNSFDWIK
jgi:hypothetical protein